MLRGVTETFTLEGDVAKGDAILSACGKYRAWLTRELGGTRPLVSIGANPSTADAWKDDQTMLTEQRFARRWGCGLLVKVNVYAYRATEPKDMWAAWKAGTDIVGGNINGLHNDDYVARAIRLAIERDGIVLFAWGKIPSDTFKKTKVDRVRHMLDYLNGIALGGTFTPMCLGKNQDGSPKHTLYQPLDKELVPWAA